VIIEFYFWAINVVSYDIVYIQDNVIWFSKNKTQTLRY